MEGNRNNADSVGQQRRVHGEPDSDAIARAKGCLLGHVVGDALGSMVVFMSGAEIRTFYPQGVRTIGPSIVHGTVAGQPTDASELTLALARSLAASGTYDEECVAGAYADWLISGPFDVGNTMRRATAAMRMARARGESLLAAARSAANRSSQANGALMRQSPLAIWGWQLAEDDLAAVVAADTSLTHPNRVCTDASTAYVVAIAAAIRGHLDGTAAYERAREWDRQHGSSPSVTTALEAAASRLPSFETNEGHVLIALQNAFYQAVHAPSFEEGLVNTVKGGGDTDTNAAVAGALLGAIHGVDSIPESWRSTVLQCRPARDTAGVRHPRPEAYWPSDAVALGEQLLRAGLAARLQLEDGSGTEGGAPGSGRPEHAPRQSTSADVNAIQEVESAARRSVTVGALNRRSRVRGALLGGALGDALGRCVSTDAPPRYAPPWPVTEFLPWHGYRGGPKGTITYLTQQTMLVAESLEALGHLDPFDLARRLAGWVPRARGSDAATTEAARRLGEGVPWYLAGDVEPGIVAALRATPVGLLRSNDPDVLRIEATSAVLPTHRHSATVAAAVAVCTTTAWLVTHDPDDWDAGALLTALQSAVEALQPAASRDAAHDVTHDSLLGCMGELPDLLRRPPDQALPAFAGRAEGVEPILEALYCFMRTPRDPEQAVLLAANGSTSPSAVAALAGTFAGAYAGDTALPGHWLEDLEYRDRLLALADNL